MPVEGVDRAQVALDALGARLHAAMGLAAYHAGLEIEASIKEHASGRPGPNVITGTLRRSVHTTAPTPIGSKAWQVYVSPSTVYARRIELGFMNMRDSLGRLYHQPAFPYVRSGFQAARVRVLPVIIDTLRAALGG